MGLSCPRRSLQPATHTGHPRLLFKGGTSLSKAFGLIARFSEDIGLVVFRDGLGFEDDRDPTAARHLSNRKRAALFDELRSACSSYIRSDLRVALTKQIDEIVEDCHVASDEGDVNGQTLVVEYPTLYPSRDVAYLAPRVRIEAGARPAVDPSLGCTVSPYVASELPGWSFEVGGIRVIAPERTYWEKLLILHGVYYGYRDTRRLPADKDRISRHYYDVAMLTETDLGWAALSNVALFDAVRNHNLIAFRQAWKRFEEAVPGSSRLVPEAELRRVIERDYGAMHGMVLGEAPEFGWVMEQLRRAEAAINRLVSEYERFSQSFTSIRAEDIRQAVDAAYAGGRFWPAPLISLNPNFVPGGSIDDLVSKGTLDEECAKIFRIKHVDHTFGQRLTLHQERAVLLPGEFARLTA